MPEINAPKKHDLAKHVLRDSETWLAMCNCGAEFEGPDNLDTLTRLRGHIKLALSSEYGRRGLGPQPWTIEGRYATPAEFVDAFTTLRREQQLHVAEIYIKNSQTTMQCFIEDHKGAVRFTRLHRCPAPHRGRRANKLMRRFK